jgi:hypothetical protein
MQSSETLPQTVPIRPDGGCSWLNPFNARTRISFTLDRVYYHDGICCRTPFLWGENLADLHTIADQLQELQQSLRHRP